VAGDFGERLTAVMTERGFSAQKLGRALGYKDGRPVRRWKNRGVTPRAETISEMARVMDVPVERLMPDGPARRAASWGDDPAPGT
jgi:transcriptional regulator with XRE-family HTH domain